jgi:hypothetical protein
MEVLALSTLSWILIAVGVVAIVAALIMKKQKGS